MLVRFMTRPLQRRPRPPPVCVSGLCAGGPTRPLDSVSRPAEKSLGVLAVSHLLGTVLGRR